MKRGKNLIGLGVAVILGLSLVLIPVLNRISPAEAAVSWTKSGEVTLDGELYVIDAWVIKDGATYRMWYTHGKKDMTFSELIDDIKGLSLDMVIESIESLDPETFLEDLADLGGDVSAITDILNGISTVIGYATSTNGTTWTVVNSEVLAGSGGAWNSIGAPSVIWDTTDNEYKMWYTRLKTDIDQTALEDILLGMGGITIEQKDAIEDLLDGTHTVIGYATSPDGITWTVENAEVLAGNGQAINSVGAASVIKDGSTYKMWYTRGKSDFAESDLDDILADITDFGLVVDDVLAVLDSSSTVIGYATSPDGITWTVVDSEVLAGNGMAWDSVADPSVIKSGGTYEMWYTQVETNLIEGTLLSLIDEMTVGLGPGILTLWDDLASKSLLDFIIEDVLTLDITNISDILSGTNAVINYATSSDGISWTPQIAPDLAGSSSPWGSVVAPTVVKTGSDYQMWFTEGIADLSWQNLLGLVLGDNLPIGYAYYTPSEPSGPSEPTPPPEEEEVIPEEEEVIPEEEEVTSEEEYTPGDIEDIAEEDIEAVAIIIEDMVEEDIEAVVDIFEEISTEIAVDIIEEVTTETAVDIIEGVTTETAVDIIEGVTTETAVDIIEGVTTDTLNGLVGEMSEESLMDTLPEVSTDTLHSVDVETLFDALPNAPTEQLTSEDPPEPPG